MLDARSGSNPVVKGIAAAVVSVALGWAGAAAAAEPTRYAKRDLQGNWTNSSLTPLERAAEYKSLEMTPAEVARLEGERQALVKLQGAATSADSDVGNSCEVKGYTGGPACGYNGAWTDPGDTVMRVKGRPRTSFITSTADGRVPANRTGEPASRRRRLVAEGRESDHPESRSLGERCLLSFGFSSGPVMLPQLYNSNYQFIQTKDELAILVEMVHDVRHIRIGAKHRNDGVRPWMGDSVGRWEGDTLVAETINFHPNQYFYGASDKLKVTERFTRIGPDRIHYAFTVEDPQTWSKPWGGEYEFGPSKGPLYEYACHEGNYGLENILAGARAEEAAAAATPTAGATSGR